MFNKGKRKNFTLKLCILIGSIKQKSKKTLEKKTKSERESDWWQKVIRESHMVSGLACAGDKAVRS